MKKKPHSEEQIAYTLRQAEARNKKQAATGAMNQLLNRDHGRRIAEAESSVA